MQSALKQAPQQQPVASVTRMRLDQVQRGKRVEPHKLIVYGTPGIGKSSFAADAPAPLFLDAERGTSKLDVARFPVPETWQDVLDAIHELETADHPYKTFVIDTLDHLEPLLWAKVCADAGVRSIDDVGGGYGKGYTAATDGWRLMLSGLERLHRKGMNIIMLAHSWIRPFKDPQSEGFDRYELKLNNKAAGLLKEWADTVLFANHETFATTDKRTKRVRGVSTGARFLYTTHTAAYDAKSRSSLPEAIPLKWFEYEGAVQANRTAAPEVLKEQVETAGLKLSAELQKQTADYLAKAGDDATKLAKLLDWVNAKLINQGDAQ